MPNETPSFCSDGRLSGESAGLSRNFSVCLFNFHGITLSSACFRALGLMSVSFCANFPFFCSDDRLSGFVSFCINFASFRSEIDGEEE
ncbi:hypothetical protein BHE74_00031958 [Ensete ventricosum]|nr:hypothetical protein BHE74_00031958 [Ensete ventricosum]